MKINKNQRIEKAVDNPGNLCENIHFKEGKLYATNGTILAVITPQECSDDIDGPIARDTFKSARGRHVTLSKDTAHFDDGSTIPRPASDKQTPNYESALDHWKDKPEMEICLNVKLLSDLCAALGTTCVKLRIQSPQELIKVETRGDDFGFIMPLRKIN